MRILFHHRTQLTDAQGIHIRAMARALENLGHEVDLIAAVGSRRGATVEEGRRWRIETRLLPRSLYEMLCLAYNLYGYRQLARAIREREPDLIYERYAPNTFCGVLASRRFGVPLLLEINGPWRDHAPTGEPPRFWQLARRLERWICSNSTHTLAVTAALRRLLIEEGVPERRVSVMHNAVDPGVFHPDVPGEGVRRRHGLSGRLVAGFVGWLRPWHGLERLIEAVHAARLLDRGLRLLIVGDGPSFANVAGRVRELGLDDRIILSGPVAHEDVPAHIAALDIALQPSATAYACPMKLLEYMAMGRCILAPDQPNIRELLSNGSNARLFPAGNYQSMVDLMSELMTSPAERTSLGRNAYRSVIERDLVWRANAARAVGLLHGDRHDGETSTGAAASGFAETSAGREAVR